MAAAEAGPLPQDPVNLPEATPEAAPAATSEATADVAGPPKSALKSAMAPPAPPAPAISVDGAAANEARLIRRAERRAVVQEPEPQPEEGPTYWRLGVDYEIDPAQEEIHHQCARIKKLENLETIGTNLKKLILIANSVEKIENLEANTELVHLELYQNLVKRIENISHLTKLEILDLSFNKIRDTFPLEKCPFLELKELYLCSNKIEEIEGIFHMKELVMTEFGANRIKSIPSDFVNLTMLQELWLGKNKISCMALPPMPSLRRLSLQNNRLESWDEALFANAPNLTHLYLGHNNLPDVPEAFGQLGELIEIDLAKNAIVHITPLPRNRNLKELWMNDNQIEDLEEVRKLASFPALRTVYLERNPMHGLGDEAKEQRYKNAILAACPGLFQLDAETLFSDVTLVTNGSEKRVMGIRKR